MLVFIDESGDHNLLKIDPLYPIFALGALLIEEDEYKRMDDEVRRIKSEFFHDDGTFVLHSSELKRPTHRLSDPRNAVMFDPAVRTQFYTKFDASILRGFDFKIIACFIRKPELRRKYVRPFDPYCLSFENLLNRIIRHGGEQNSIIAEQRGAELDTELLAEYERLSKVGIQFYSADTVRERTHLQLMRKKDNESGLQIIDLILASLTRAALGKEHKMAGNDVSPLLSRAKYACPPTFFPERRRLFGL